eukprot:2982795-Ditylum_brightwellii.AAC.1
MPKGNQQALRKGKSDNDDDNEISDENEEDNSKTKHMVLDMAKSFFGSGRTVSMDNYYEGAEALIKLK